jgi:hypothetical protein
VKNQRQAPKRPTPRVARYTAGLEIQRGGITVQIAEVPSRDLEEVVRHALAALTAAGLISDPNDDRPLEQVGGYSPLDVRDDDFAEQGKRPKRVGF